MAANEAKRHSGRSARPAGNAGQPHRSGSPEGAGASTAAPAVPIGQAGAIEAGDKTVRVKHRAPCGARPVAAMPGLQDAEAMPTDQLRRLLLRLAGRKDAGRMSRELLLRAVAWHLQMKAALEGHDRAIAEAARAVERRNKAMLRAIRNEMEQRQRNGPETAQVGGQGQGAAAAAGEASLSDLRIPGSGSRKRRRPSPPAKALPPGSRLIREWRGETHEVIVQSDGTLLWRGKAWKSLSVIARTITGVAWSGPRFFGTTEGRSADG